jgi:hypothetical protein
MSTHDADNKPTENPADRRTMTRDPNAPGGPIVETEETKRGNHVTVAGSTHMTANIDGKWYVVNSRGEKLLQRPFDTETEAVEEAQRRNPERPEDSATPST